MQNTTINGQTKFCKHCGNKIPEAAVICTHCGCQVEQLQQADQHSIVINNSNVNTNTNTNSIGEPVAAPVAPAAEPIAEPTAPVSENTVGNGLKKKDKWLAFFLCLLLGYFGAHKFYEGRILMGILYFFTAGLFCIGWVVDCIILLCKPNPYYV